MNRAWINHIAEDVLCARIMLASCGLIILGPQPGDAVITNQTTHSSLKSMVVTSGTMHRQAESAQQTSVESEIQ